MCCWKKTPAETKKMIAILWPGRRKWTRLWKRLHKSGYSPLASYLYSPGTHTVPPIRRYRTGCPKGFHVYLEKPGRPRYFYARTAVPVWCHRDDLVRIGWGEAVFTRIRIRRDDWVRAGLPLLKKKKP